METKRANVNAAGDDEGAEGKGCDKTSYSLPEPSFVLFPRERIQLGWRKEEASLAGSGMVNTGVICYINSTLQALFHIPAFTNWLMNDDEHGKACVQMTESSKYDCMVCIVKVTFWLSQVYTGSSFQASYITDHLSHICQHLSTRRQEDAHEFLCYLIESMDRSYLHVSGHADKSLDAYSKETTPVNQIFGGYTRTEVTCEECGHQSTTFQHFQDLILDIDRSDTVRDALHNYFEGEQLSYVCGGCQKEVLAIKKFSIEKAPNVLCVQLKRYELTDGSDGSKNNKVIQIDERMDLSDCVFGTDAPPAGYHLVSMVNHYGRSLDEGHYTTVGLTSFGSYYNFDDSIVHQTSFEEQCQSKNSYLIFYELDPLEVAKDAGAKCETTSTNAEPLRQVPEEDGLKVDLSIDITTSKPLSIYNSLSTALYTDSTTDGNGDKDLVMRTPAVAGTSYPSDQLVSERRSIERLSAEERAFLLPQGHLVSIDGVEFGSDARKEFVNRNSPTKRSFDYDHDDDRIVKKKKFDNRQTEDNNERLRPANQYEWITETSERTTKNKFEIHKKYNENGGFDHSACGDGR